MARLRKPISLSTRYASGARKPKAKTSTIRRGELVGGFAATSFLLLSAVRAMTKFTLMGWRPASKVGLLIHFMLFQIPLPKLQKLNLIAKVRLIAPNKRIPNLPLGFG
jgi:hypothetical protein